MSIRTGSLVAIAASLHLLLQGVACATTTAPPQAASRPSAVPPSPNPPGPMSSQAPAVPPGSASAEATPVATEEWQSPLEFKRVLQVPVKSLTLGRSPFVAVLSDSAWMSDGKSWKELAFSGAAAKEGAAKGAVGIFFGRDDKPRLMGARDADGHRKPVYFRWKNGWEKDPKELGRLAGRPDDGMYGVIGDEDPEVVCKVGDVCVIKRRTGWKTIAAGEGLGRIHLCHGDAWMIDDKGLARLDGERWVRLPDLPESRGKETGWWADPQGGRVRVSVASLGAIYRLQDGKWEREEVPIRTPGAMWGSSARDVWVVGSDGVAHYDGTAWVRVKGFSGAWEHVAGRGEGEVWLAGPQGLWEGRKR